MYFSLFWFPKLSFKRNVYAPAVNPVYLNGYTDVPPVNEPGTILSKVYGGTPPVGVIIKVPNPVSQVPVRSKV